jgi:hypothetical protein
MQNRIVFIIEFARYQVDVEARQRFDATAFHGWLSNALDMLTPDQRSVAELSINASPCGDDLPEISNITLSYQRWETDEEVDRRLATEQQQHEEEARRRENQERAEYERLKKKFGG